VGSSARIGSSSVSRDGCVAYANSTLTVLVNSSRKMSTITCLPTALNPRTHTATVWRQQEMMPCGKSRRSTKATRCCSQLTAGSAVNMPRRLGRKAYTSLAAASRGSESNFGLYKQPTASSPQVWSGGSDWAGWSTGEHLKTGQDLPTDAVSTKSFSSVSVQNVHAMGRLPHMLDGTSDSQRRSAKSMLSAAGKTRNPPLASGPVPTSTVLYQPHSRHPVGRGMESDDVFQPQFVRQEGM
jgi:hypothetical protein